MNILNPEFKYTPSHATDIRKTIARERERLTKAKKQKPATPAVIRSNRKQAAS